MSLQDPSSLPSKQRGLLITDSDHGPELTTLPVPEVVPGSVLLHVIASPVLSYANEILYNNVRKYTYPLPLIPGFSAIGRLAAAPPDATSLRGKEGSLVLFDCFIRARDAQHGGQIAYLSAIHDGHTSESKALMKDGDYRNGSYAEFVRVPQENVFLIDEEDLARQLCPDAQNLSLPESEILFLCEIPKLLVPYGGFSSIDLRPGELVLISPATGPFGSAACIVALSMGCHVLAWGRNPSKLADLQAYLEQINRKSFAGRVTTLVLHDDPEKDKNAISSATKNRQIDVYFDISPTKAQKGPGTPTYVRTGIMSLRHSGRVCFMGGFREDVPIPHSFVMHFDITIKGKWMYTRDDIRRLIRMVEIGTLKLGKEGGMNVSVFNLEQWKDAWDAAEREGEKVGSTVVITS